MKYIVLLGDGMSDYPLENRGGKTPLQISRTPAMDELAAKGRLGLAKTIPDGLAPGSDVANLSVMGYDPHKYYSGRSPIEAASIGVELAETDVAFRCNLVTLGRRADGLHMDDYSAGHITTGDASVIIKALKERFDSQDITFYQGVSYRHLMVWREGRDELTTTPPHDITDQNIDGYLPGGPGSEIIRGIMDQSRDLLAGLNITKQKGAAGERSANAVWLWGQGRALKIPSFASKYGLSGSVISAVDLVKGLGLSAGLGSIDVPGATGYLDTNYRGKVDAALKELEAVDFVYLHVEAPDEASHKGSFEEKIQAIEDFDARVVAPVMAGLAAKHQEYRIMLLPDHPTPLALKTHASDPVPFVIYASEDSRKQAKPGVGYNEADAATSKDFIADGWQLMDRFIKIDDKKADELLS